MIFIRFQTKIFRTKPVDWPKINQKKNIISCRSAKRLETLSPCHSYHYYKATSFKTQKITFHSHTILKNKIRRTWVKFMRPEKKMPFIEKHYLKSFAFSLSLFVLYSNFGSLTRQPSSFIRFESCCDIYFFFSFLIAGFILFTAECSWQRLKLE